MSSGWEFFLYASQSQHRVPVDQRTIEDGFLEEWHQTLAGAEDPLACLEDSREPSVDASIPDPSAPHHVPVQTSEMGIPVPTGSVGLLCTLTISEEYNVVIDAINALEAVSRRT